MTLKKAFTVFGFAAALMAAGPVLAEHHMAGHDMKDGTMHGEEAMSQTVADVAMSSPKFTTLVTAVQAAGLAGALQGDGPITVFAPTNAAFEKLPDGTLDMLMQPENKARLKAILTYHVVPANVTDSDFDALTQSGNGELEVTTLQGETLTLTKKRQNTAAATDELLVVDATGNEADIVMSNVTASNGVIHAIDTVLMPGDTSMSNEVVRANDGVLNAE